jgi:hypothetical protein
VAGFENMEAFRVSNRDRMHPFTDNVLVAQIVTVAVDPDVLAWRIRSCVDIETTSEQLIAKLLGRHRIPTLSQQNCARAIVAEGESGW